jgi:iron complex outermembrane receptor protein
MKRIQNARKNNPYQAAFESLTPIAAAVGLMILSTSYAQAQQADAPAPSAAPEEGIQQVYVQGIRAALAQSLNQKKNADSHVEVITAEDIGKMPDKNVADSLQRVPGVNVSNAGASEGGFDENDRVSMRGTNANLTQTLINGHNVASGDWFVLNQTSQVGRSVSYTLVPSELVGSVVVHKSSEASLIEGGVAGSVDIITRKPLEFKNAVTAEASVGAVYAQLPKKTDPQLSALVNWKNEAKTFGALLQVFSETRHLRRDGQEILSYDKIAPNSPMALAHPDLANAYYPGFLGAALFEQERKRQGALLDLQFKPSRAFDIDLNAFSSKLDASNTNNNYLLNGGAIIAQGTGQAPEPGYTVSTKNGVKTLTSATFAPVAGANYNEYDQISRPGERATANFLSLDAKFRATDALTLRAKGGTSEGKGDTPVQDVIAWNGATGTGASYRLNGLGSAADFGFGSGNPAASPGTSHNPGSTDPNSGFGWMFGDQNISVVDKEKWLQLDGDFAVSAGPVNLIKFGVRAADHDRSSQNVIGQGPTCSTRTDAAGGPGFFWAAPLASQYSCINGANSPYNPANWPAAGGAYPSNFGSGLGGNFPRSIFLYTADQLAAFGNKFSTRPTDGTREDFGQEFTLNEKTRAAYIQANFEGSGWSGNVGLRYVQTKEHAISNFGLPGNTPANVPGVVYGSLFGIFKPTATDHTYNDILPSANLRLELAPDLIARFAVSKTMTRPDYSSLVGSVALTPPAAFGQTGSGSGGNPDLKPVRSTNFDASLEWYYAPKSLLSASAYYMDLTNYIGQGTTIGTYKTFTDATKLTFPNGFDAQYLITSPINSTGKVKGVELAWEQPVLTNFGFATNLTLTNAKDDSGAKVLGASRHTYNISAYFEDERFNARLTWSARSDAYVGIDRGTEFNQVGSGDLNASLGYMISKNIALSLDARNINNPKLKYYALNEDQPRSVYQNGRQFFLTMRMKY